MSKKARAAAADRRLKEKRSRKASQKARYAAYRDAGTNSKRKSRQNAKSGGVLAKCYKTPNRNRRRTKDVTMFAENGQPFTVRRGGTVSLKVFCRQIGC